MGHEATPPAADGASAECVWCWQKVWSMLNPGPDDDLGPRSLLRSWSTQNRPLITVP